MLYVYDSDKYSRARSGTVLVKHIARNQDPSSSSLAVLCPATVKFAVRHDSNDPAQRRLSQHITCARCAKMAR
jgi:hypothetical protein